METLLRTIKSWVSLDEATQKLLIAIAIKIGIFLLFILLAWIFGKSVPRYLKVILRRFLPQMILRIYENLVDPVEKNLGILVTLILFSVCLNFIQEYKGFYLFLKFFLDLSIAISIPLFISGVFRYFLRIYGMELIRKLGFEVMENNNLDQRSLLHLKKPWNRFLEQL